MVYVTRNPEGEVIAISSDPNTPGAVATSADDPGVQEFLANSDLEMVRVIEDVIDLLVDRRMIRFTDLPQSAQRKLLGRKTLRSRLSGIGPLVGGEDDLI
jgi:hypothetical protein